MTIRGMDPLQRCDALGSGGWGEEGEGAGEEGLGDRLGPPLNSVNLRVVELGGGVGWGGGS